MRLIRPLQLLLLIFVLFLQLRPIDDLDLFTQITLGRRILSEGLILPESFSYLHLGDIVSNPGWLAQVIFALVERVGSWPLLKAFYALLFSTPFILLAALPRLKGREFSTVAILCSTLLAFLITLSNSSVRPQGMSFLCFALLIYYLELRCLTARQGIKEFAALALLLLFWANCHPSLSAGAVLVICYLCAEFLSGERDRTKIFNLTTVLIAVGIAHFATPLGIKALDISAYNVEISKWLGISEWQAPWHPSVMEAMFGFWLAVSISALLFFREQYRTLKAREVVTFGCFLVLSFYGARFAVYWALVSIPVWARLLDKHDIVRRFGYPKGEYSFWSTSLGALGVACLVNLSSALPKLAPSLPLTCIEKLKEVLPGDGRIFNYREWGGILTYLGYPKWTVHIDGRLYLYTKAEWVEYNEISLGNVPISALTERYKVKAFFLHKNFHLRLIEQLKQDSAWRELWGDEHCSVFIEHTI